MVTDYKTNWSGVRVAVTGADGFIGSHLAEELVRRGAEVRALAQYNSFDSYGWLDDISDDLRPSIELVRGDIRDPGQMISFCRDREILFHLAALISIPFSYDAPSAYIQTNVQGTANILSAALAGGLQRVVHTSTSEVYGTAQYVPINESHPLQGQSPYSASKIGADMMAESFFRSFDCPVVTLRPFNTYGPRQSERAVLPTIIRQALDPNCAEIRLGDLTPKRDFCYVQDTVAAFLAITQIAPAMMGRAYNAGTGKMVTIGEALDIVCKITDADKPAVAEAGRNRPAKSEVFTLQADAAALRESVGWEPVTCLEDGLRQTVAWWQSRPNAYRADGSYIY